MKKAFVILFLLALVAAPVGFTLWSSGGQTQAAEVLSLSGIGMDLSPRGSNSRLRLLALDMDYALGNDELTGATQDFDTIDDRISGIINAITIYQPDIVVLYDVPFSGARTADVDIVGTLSAEAEMPYAVRTTSWNERYAAYPLWPIRDHAGRIEAGTVILSRFELVDATGELFGKSGGDGFVGALWGPQSSLTEVGVVVNENDSVLLTVMDLRSAVPPPTREPGDYWGRLTVRRVIDLPTSAATEFDIVTEGGALMVQRDTNFDFIRSAATDTLDGRISTPVVTAEIQMVQPFVIRPGNTGNEPGVEMIIDENGPRVIDRNDGLGRDGATGNIPEVREVGATGSAPSAPTATGAAVGVPAGTAEEPRVIQRDGPPAGGVLSGSDSGIGEPPAAAGEPRTLGRQPATNDPSVDGTETE